MTTHTPGPWELLAGRTFKTCNGEFYLAYGKDAHGNPKFWSQENGWSEMDANARLVAAAPCLLEALESALFALKTSGYDLEDCAATGLNMPLGKQINEAIAKAKGETTEGT